jgi:soluble lytic murein transglycosylase
MVSRHLLLGLLFFAVVGALSVVGPTPSHSAVPAAEADGIPEEAMAALRQGRYLRASLILRDYLASRADTTEAAILLTARAEAGWGAWDQVRELLEGRQWLDRVGAGYGWSLLGRSQIEQGAWREGAVSLGRYLSVADSSGQLREPGLAQLRRARALVEQREYQAAIAAYDDARRMLPQIEDWIHVFAASAAASAADTATVRQRLAQVDPSLAKEWAWRTELRARRQAGDLPGAQLVGERAAAAATTPARRAMAWTAVGDVRRARGSPVGARAAYLRAMEEAQGSSAALDAARALSGMAGSTPVDQLAVGRLYLRHGNLARGTAGVQAYLDAGLGTPTERERIRYELAAALLRAGRTADAERALHELAATATDRATVAEALHDLGRAYHRTGRTDAAGALLLRAVREFPDQPAAASAAFFVADLEHDALRLDRAAELYRATIRIAPGTGDAARAHMRLGGIYFAQHRLHDALREFEEFRSAHPTGPAQQQATFWVAQTLAALGRDDEARARFLELNRSDPFSYYGGLAAEAAGQDHWHRRLEPAPPHSERFAAQVERALARIDLLREVGWDDAAAFEMERVRRHFARFDGALYDLAEALNERGLTQTAITIGREIRRREGAWNVRLLRIVYPFPYRNIIVAEARDRNVDPFLAAALIRQESMFDHAARSPAGAIGLMQVMPRTGQAIARSLNFARFEPGQLTRPELNVIFGTAYLAEQLHTYSHRLDVVLAAYNAGPGRVARWRSLPEFRHPLLFAERIPFPETRDYVRIVQTNRRIYAAIYSDLLAGPVTD